MERFSNAIIKKINILFKGLNQVWRLFNKNPINTAKNLSKYGLVITALSLLTILLGTISILSLSKIFIDEQPDYLLSIITLFSSLYLLSSSIHYTLGFILRVYRGRTTFDKGLLRESLSPSASFSTFLFLIKYALASIIYLLLVGIAFIIHFFFLYLIVSALIYAILLLALLLPKNLMLILLPIAGFINLVFILLVYFLFYFFLSILIVLISFFLIEKYYNNKPFLEALTNPLKIILNMENTSSLVIFSFLLFGINNAIVSFSLTIIGIPLVVALFNLLSLIPYWVFLKSNL